MVVGARPGWLIAIVAMLTACDHSPTYLPTSYGAVGPFRTIDGVSQLTTGGASSGTWTADGQGILGLMVGGVPGLKCMGILPPGGGSATWNRCPVWPRVRADIDSAYAIVAPTLGATGRLLYVGAIGPLQKPSQNYPFPVGWHAQLFVVDTSEPFTSRRPVATLYHDHLGISAFPPDEVSWLERIHWIGRDSFVALGENLSPNSTITPLHVVLGVIGTSAATMTPIPGTTGARLLSVAESGKTLVYLGDQLNIAQVPITGGEPQVIVALPAAPQRSVLDISCQHAACLLLTHEATGANLWAVSSTGEGLRVVRSFTGSSPSSAALAPGTGDVVMQMNGQFYLLQGLLPN